MPRPAMRSEAIDPAARSFVDVAPDSPFPLQNLPYGIFRTHDQPRWRAGVAIGEFVLDLAALEEAGLLAPGRERVFDRPALNAFIALGRTAWRQTRERIAALLSADEAALRDHALRERALLPLQLAELALPIEVAGYTDFYSSKEHATN